VGTQVCATCAVGTVYAESMHRVHRLSMSASHVKYYKDGFLQWCSLSYSRGLK